MPGAARHPNAAIIARTTVTVVVCVVLRQGDVGVIISFRHRLGTRTGLRLRIVILANAGRDSTLHRGQPHEQYEHYGQQLV